MEVRMGYAINILLKSELSCNRSLSINILLLCLVHLMKFSNFAWNIF